MKIDIKNLGTIKSGSLETNNLTIIFGKNNSGKTYLSYSTYIIYKKLSDIINSAYSFDEVNAINSYSTEGNIQTIEINVEQHLFRIMTNLQGRIKKEIVQGFKVKESFFKDTVINLNIDTVKRNFYNLEETIECSDIINAKHSIISKGSDSWLVTVKVIDTKTTQPGKDDFTRNTIDENTMHFINGVFKNEINKEITRCILKIEENNSFIVTSERTGIELFYKEIDRNRSNIAESMSLKNKNNRLNKEIIKNIISESVSDYSSPISDNIKSIRDGYSAKSGDLTNSNNFQHIIESLKKISKGSFLRNDIGNTVFIANNKIEIPLPIASSSIKSISLIDLYINNLASIGDTLIIDEPELNLHPDNQIKMAELIARLVNSKIRVMITTHSDYLVREINNRIKLHSLFKKDKNKAMSYVDLGIDIIDPNIVSIYNISEDGFLSSVDIDNDGMGRVIFDEVIESSYFREANISEDLEDDRSAD